jgi:hypothetical protein
MGLHRENLGAAVSVQVHEAGRGVGLEASPPATQSHCRAGAQGPAIDGVAEDAVGVRVVDSSPRRAMGVARAWGTLDRG